MDLCKYSFISVKIKDGKQYDVYVRSDNSSHLTPWRRGQIQQVHGLLRCQSEYCQFALISNPGRIVSKYWNRDDVATLNIRAVVQETILTGERPLQLLRYTYLDGLGLERESGKHI